MFGRTRAKRTRLLNAKRRNRRVLFLNKNNVAVGCSDAPAPDAGVPLRCLHLQTWPELYKSLSRVSPSGGELRCAESCVQRLALNNYQLNYERHRPYQIFGFQNICFHFCRKVRFAVLRLTLYLRVAGTLKRAGKLQPGRAWTHGLTRYPRS